MLFLVAYSNFIFQIYLPMSEADLKLEGGTMDLTYCPTFLDLEGVHLTRKKLDMSSKVKVLEEEEKIEMQFEDMKELSVPPITDDDDDDD